MNAMTATRTKPAPPAPVLTMDDLWPLAADWPCCVPHCSIRREPGRPVEWEPVHNDNCPTRQT